MKYHYEFINHVEKLPIKIFIHNVDRSPYHWHEDIELLFVLKGKIDVVLHDQEYILEEKDIFLSNSYELHSTHFLESNQTLALQIDPDYFNEYYPRFKNLRFKLNSMEASEEEQRDLDYVRQLLAKIMEAIYKEEDGYILRIEKILFELVLLLVNKFVDEDKENDEVFIAEEGRLKNIIQYIDENYSQDLSLSEIAENEHLNPQYFSRYFKKHMGISPNKYITSVRLKKSSEDLLMTDMRIMDIALKNGFPNTKSYYKAFKDAFNTTPVEYKKKFKRETVIRDNGFDYFEVNKENAFRNLFEYLHIVDDEVEIMKEVKVRYDIDTRKTQGALEQKWRVLTTFGRASEGLRAEWRDQLRTIQEEIPFDYIRFHEIFSDEMMIYNEDDAGNPYYNFGYLDDLVDFLLEVKIRPFFEIGFMPSELASKDEYVFWRKANVSYPKDIEKWKDLIKAFMDHLIERYGRWEVRSWYFEIWNEPDFSGVFWHDTDERFYDLFKHTYHMIRSIDSDLKVGGLSLLSNTIMEDDYLESFNAFAEANDIHLDFFTFHVYPVVMNMRQIESIVKKHDSYIGDPNLIMEVKKHYKYADEAYISNTITSVVEEIKNYNFTKDEIFITEWNSSADSRDLIHDTAFMAAFLVKNVLANAHKLSGMGYWTFTDIFEEFKLGQGLFHGGFGFMTHNGLKKPIFHGYKLLNKLGTTIIDQGEDYIITKSDEGSYQILAYNYVHYNDLFSEYDTSQISERQRYDVFKEQKVKKLHFNLMGLEGQYVEKTYRLNRAHGSVFDLWVEMGAPAHPTKEELAYLKNKSQLSYRTKRREIEAIYTWNIDLAPHEVVLVEITAV